MSQLTQLLIRCRQLATGDASVDRPTLITDIDKMLRTWTVTLGYPHRCCDPGDPGIYTWIGVADSAQQANDVAKDAMLQDNGGDDAEFSRDEIEEIAADIGDLS